VRNKESIMQNNYDVDKYFCMSSFLTFRYIFDEHKIFKEGIERTVYPLPEKKYMIRSADDIDVVIEKVLSPVVDKQTGIMLSGGMDSAILASYLPAGTKAYTLENLVEGGGGGGEKKIKRENAGFLVFWEDGPPL
jgi:hypothetical protein